MSLSKVTSIYLSHFLRTAVGEVVGSQSNDQNNSNDSPSDPTTSPPLDSSVHDAGTPLSMGHCVSCKCSPEDIADEDEVRASLLGADSDSESETDHKEDKEEEEAADVKRDPLSLRRKGTVTIMKAALKGIKRDAKLLAKFRKENPSVQDIMVVSFSQMKKKYLPRLGAKLHRVETAMFMSALEAVKSQSDIVSEVGASWEDEGKKLVAILQFVNEHVIGKHEAVSRMFIDPFLLHVGRISKQGMGFCFILPELHVSSTRAKNEKDKPIAVINESDTGSMGTLLTGIGDYVAFAGRSQGEHADTKLKDDVKKAPMLADVVDAFSGFQDVICLSIEAKGEQENLFKHIPQVVAQCIAILSRLDNTTIGNTGVTVPWCITNGYQWLFGFVSKHKPAVAKESSQTYYDVYYPAQPMIVDYNKSLKDLTASARKVLETLCIWVDNSSSDVLGNLSSSSISAKKS